MAEAVECKSAVAVASDQHTVANNDDWPGAVLAAATATAADTSLNLPNLPDSDPEPTADACYLYWVVRHELVGFIAAIIASFIVVRVAVSSGFLNA